MVSAQDLEAFIFNYKEADLERVKFNPTFEETSFYDLNLEFRGKVIQEVLKMPGKVPVILIRDLLLEEAKYAVKAWAVMDHFSKLAENLLRFGGETYLKDFCHAISRSFDTLNAAKGMNLKGVNINELLKELDRLIKEESEELKQKELQCGKDLIKNFQTK